MAVFFVNTCKFNSCGITFPTLQELIRHIEETHLNFDPQALEEHQMQHPSCLPISYVLRVFSSDYHGPSHAKREPTSLTITQLRNKSNRSHSPALSITSTTPTGSEMDEENYPSESEDSWSNVSNEGESNILKYAVKRFYHNQFPYKIIIMNATTVVNNTEEADKPYPCFVNGCKKRYRNANGLKYHIKNTHPSCMVAKRDPHEPVKIFRCECGKEYKTPYGLKNHISTHHSNQGTSGTQAKLPPSVRMDVIPVRPSQSVFTASQAIGNNIAPAQEPRTMANLNSNTHESGAVEDINLTYSDASSSNEISGELNRDEDRKICGVIDAPTLQHHLLKPIMTKTGSN